MPSRQTQSDSDSVVESSSQPDYAAVSLPSEPPTEYGYVERRAELLQQVRDLGHPSMIHQGEAAERYGVTQQQISKDLDRIAEYVQESLGARHDLSIDAVFQRSIQGLLEEGEYRKAAQTAKDYDEWVVDRTGLAELREQVEDLQRGDGGSGDYEVDLGLTPEQADAARRAELGEDPPVDEETAATIREALAERRGEGEDS